MSRREQVAHRASRGAGATSLTALAFSQLSSSGFYTCGVTTSFKAYCWGFNENGELGNGSTASREGTPVAVAGGHQFREVSADGHHTCAVTTDDRAYCWGLNDDGQLGDGTTSTRLAPVPVLGGLRFSQVQAGHSHTCGVTKPDGLAYCWGRGGYLGDGTTNHPLEAGPGCRWPPLPPGERAAAGTPAGRPR